VPVIRGWEIARLGWGVALLAFPGWVCELLTATPLDRRASIVTRVLGARTLIQTVVVCAHRSRRAVLLGAAVDSAHAATMAPLVLRSHTYATPAAVSASVAAASAAEALGHLPTAR
jgi:hypothetical protein